MKTPGLGQGKEKTVGQAKNADIAGRAKHAGGFSHVWLPLRQKKQSLQPNVTEKPGDDPVKALQAVIPENASVSLLSRHLKDAEVYNAQPEFLGRSMPQNIPGENTGIQLLPKTQILSANLMRNSEKSSIRFVTSNTNEPAPKLPLDAAEMNHFANFLLETVFPIDESQSIELIQEGKIGLTMTVLPSEKQDGNVKLILQGKTREQRTLFAGQLLKEFYKHPLVNVTIKKAVGQTITSPMVGQSEAAPTTVKVSLGLTGSNLSIKSDERALLSSRVVSGLAQGDVAFEDPEVKQLTSDAHSVRAAQMKRQNIPEGVSFIKEVGQESQKAHQKRTAPGRVTIHNAFTALPSVGNDVKVGAEKEDIPIQQTIERFAGKRPVANRSTRVKQAEFVPDKMKNNFLKAAGDLRAAKSVEKSVPTELKNSAGDAGASGNAVRPAKVVGNVSVGQELLASGVTKKALVLQSSNDSQDASLNKTNSQSIEGPDKYSILRGENALPAKGSEKKISNHELRDHNPVKRAVKDLRNDIPSKQMMPDQPIKAAGRKEITIEHIVSGESANKRQATISAPLVMDEVVINREPLKIRSVRKSPNLQVSESSSAFITNRPRERAEPFMIQLSKGVKIRVQRDSRLADNRLSSAGGTSEVQHTSWKQEVKDETLDTISKIKLDGAVKPKQILIPPAIERLDIRAKNNGKKKNAAGRPVDNIALSNTRPGKGAQNSYRSTATEQNTFSDNYKPASVQIPLETEGSSLEDVEVQRGKKRVDSLPETNAKSFNLHGPGETGGASGALSKRDYLKLFRMIRHVAHRYQSSQNSEQIQSTFRLMVAGLGKLDIQIFEDEAGMSMHIRVENEGLRNQLERNMIDLQDMLAEVKIGLGSLALDVGENGAQQKEKAPLRSLNKNLDEEDEAAEEQYVRYLGTNTIEIYA